MDIDLFNLLEGIFWIGLGVWLVLTRRVERKRRHTVLAVGLVLFGLSDFVEMHTGAWWQPWWLLAWKALCVGVFVLIFIIGFNERRQQWRRK